MAQKSNNSEHKGGLFGFFQGIGEFFKNMFHKVLDALGIKPALPDKQPHSFKSTDQIWANEAKFEGLNQMEQEESGLMRVPPGTEKSWPAHQIERYQKAIHEQFPDRADPARTHNAGAFTSIAKDIRSALGRDGYTFRMYALGDTIITTRTSEGACKLTIHMGDKESVSMDITDPNKAAEMIATMYAKATVPNMQSTYFVDPNTQHTYAIFNVGDDIKTYTVAPMVQYQPVADSDKKERVVVPGVHYIHGPAMQSGTFYDALVPFENADITDKQLGSILYKMHKEVASPDNAQTYSAVCIVGDKRIWATTQDGQVTMHVAQAHCPYEVAQVDIPIVGKKFINPNNEQVKMQAVLKAVINAMGTLNERVAEAHEIAQKKQDIENADKNINPAPVIPERASFNINQGKLEGTLSELVEEIRDSGGTEEGVAVHLTAGEHTIVISGYTCLVPGENDTTPAIETSASIAIDGRVLYMRDFDTGETRGTCESLESALAEMQNVVGDSEVFVKDYGFFELAMADAIDHLHGETPDGDAIEYDGFEEQNLD